MVMLLLYGAVGLLREAQKEQPTPLQVPAYPTGPTLDTTKKVAIADQKEQIRQDIEETEEQERLRLIEVAKELRAQREIDEKRQINRQSRSQSNNHSTASRLPIGQNETVGKENQRKQRASTRDVIDRVRAEIEEFEQEQQRLIRRPHETTAPKAATNGHCFHRRKLIVDVDKSGFGNRLVGLTSAVMLALMTNRVLFLKWTPDTEKCGSTFEDLYEIEHIISSPYKAFYMWNESDKNINHVKASECYYYL